MDVTAVLAQAYDMDQCQHNRSSAVQILQNAAANDPDGQLQAEMTRLQTVVKARKGGCHISQITYDLLTLALSPPTN